MRVQKSAMKHRNRTIKAETEVSPEATDLLFETEDVAQLIAEVTGEDVEVEADGESVAFSVGDETYTCEAEAGDEVVESSRKVVRRNKISASRKLPKAGRTVRRLHK